MVELINRTKHREYEEYYHLIDEYYLKTLKVLNLKDEYELSLVLVGPITIRRINREYRHLDRVTDVISFALRDNDEGFKIVPIELGDIFINLNRVKSQAKEYGHSEKREFVFLFVHGLLHLLGYDHMKKEDEEVMFNIQKKIVGDLK